MDTKEHESELVKEVRGLLKLLGQLDPNAGAERHPEWPLQLRGDEDATQELCERLNRLQKLVMPESTGAVTGGRD